MKGKGFAKTDAPPLLLDVDFDYEKRRGVYILKPFDPSVEFEDALELLEGKVLFPNVSPVGDLFRRVDGCWLKFEDSLTSELVGTVCEVVLSGGYPPQFEFAAPMLVERLKSSGVEESEAVARAAFALAQACATGALGEFRVGDFGYVRPEPAELSPPPAERAERQSLYAGRLALWEVGEEGEAAHALYAHAFRRVYAASDEAEEFDGRSVLNAIEYICRKKGAKGNPHPARGEAAYEIALMLEAGLLYFEDECPDPFPHS